MSSALGTADPRPALCLALLVFVLLAGCGGAPVHVGLGAGVDASFTSATVLTGQTVDITATVTGTDNKSVVWSVCDGSGANCVAGGNAVRGTIAEIGKDAQGNSIARYTAPAGVPAPPDCRAETSGCSVVLSGRLLAFNVSCFARVTLEPATNPVPGITSLAPSTAIVGGAGFTLTVNGSNLIAGSVVRWEGSDRATTFISSTQLEAAILAGDLAAAGAATVTVFNPPPDGGTSNMAVFNINNPAPLAGLLTPSTAVAGGAAFTLTVDGSGFVAASEVQWNGSPRTTAFVSGAQVTAAIPDTDIAAAGAAMVTVVNPPPGGGPSNPLAFTTAVPICTGGVSGTTRVNVATDGTEANAGSVSGLFGGLAVSSTGRFVVFHSTAGNLVPNDTNNKSDVFVRDTCEGAVGCTPSTARVSVASDGTEGNDDSSPASAGEIGSAMSSTGRFVVFASRASNLAAGDTNGVTDIFVHDRDANDNGIFDETCAGCRKTVRVSVASDGSQGNGSTFEYGSVSDSGRFVAFTSSASNLVAGDINTQDVFLHDRDADGNGIFDETGGISTALASVATDGTQGNGAANQQSLSGNGRFVAFPSDATNLVPGGDANGVLTDIFVRDTCFGAPIGCTPTTVRVSEATDGTQGNNFSRIPVISTDGHFVAFHSLASNLVAGDSNGLRDAFVRDRDTDGNGIFDEPGGVATVRVSAASDGTEGNGNSFPGFSFSSNGRFIPFLSEASNLVTGDTNGVNDVFVRDRDTDGNGIFDEPGGVATVRASVAIDCTEGNGGSGDTSISADGRFVVFESVASNLVAGDTNGAQDVFIVRTGVP